MKLLGLTLGVLMIMFILFAVPCFAQEHVAEEAAGAGSAGANIRFLASALAVGICAIATGIAQSRIGAAGVGAIVEKPDSAGIVIILLAIPETMVILGFVVAVVLLFT